MRAIHVLRPGFLGLLLLSSACISVRPQEGAPATPQRPTVSSDTNTTSEGTLELETGLVWDHDDLLDTPSTLKMGVSERTELFVGWSPVLHLRVPGEDQTGVGDVVLGTRHRLRDEVGGSPSLAVQSIIKLPTAREEEGLGSGEVDVAFAAIVTKTVEQVSATGFYELGLLGDARAGTDVRHSLALAAGRPLGGRAGVFSELAGIFVPAADLESVFLTTGATWTPRPSTVFDVSIGLGLSSDAPNTRLQIGFTRNLGPVSGARALRP